MSAGVEFKQTEIVAFADTFETKENKTIRIFDQAIQERISFFENSGLPHEKLVDLKEKLSSNWKLVVENEHLKLSGSDAEYRPILVNLQCFIEQYLSEEFPYQIPQATVYIHTPLPPTPCCTEATIPSTLADESIRQDPARLKTIQDRTVSIQHLLQKGVTLVAAYPQSGYAKRKPEEQAVYNSLKDKYPTLIDTQLKCESLDPALVGATYHFKDKNGDEFLFSLSISQAIAPGTIDLALWFGPLKSPVLQDRLKEIESLIESNRSS